MFQLILIISICAAHHGQNILIRHLIFTIWRMFVRQMLWQKYLSRFFSIFRRFQQTRDIITSRLRIEINLFNFYLIQSCFGEKKVSLLLLHFTIHEVSAIHRIFRYISFQIFQNAIYLRPNKRDINIVLYQRNDQSISMMNFKR